MRILHHKIEPVLSLINFGEYAHTETDFSWNLFIISVKSTNEDSSEEHVNI